MSLKNFLPQQYDETGQHSINHNYLQQQFADHEKILAKIAAIVRQGDFTLGRAVDQFENRWAKIIGVDHAIGVGSGTDALLLSLKALGIGAGDEVITTPFTFFATIGAIVTSGATPVFVDVQDDYNIDVTLIEEKITKHTKAILPVHWAGKPCNMDQIQSLATQYSLFIVEDACHAIAANYKGKNAGTFGDTSCFSMHPLKNINVWGDGGVICTNNNELADKLRLMRNHGLINRDQTALFSFNSRLDTIQAVVANHLLDKLEHITNSRIAHSQYFDTQFSDFDEIIIPPREIDIKQVFHLYSIRTDTRDKLVKFLINNNVDAKIHYPIPMHLQAAAEYLGYSVGDFPEAEKIANSIFSLPVHEFIERESQDRVVELMHQYFNG